MIKNPYLQPLVRVVKDLIHITGFDVVRYDLYHSEDKLFEKIIQYFKIKTILDVGANTGQYGKSILRHGFKGNIHSFEPIQTVFEVLAKKAKRYPNWSVYNYGLGSREEEISMNISENFVSSSILKVGEVSLQAEPKTKITHQEKIKITTLDHFFEGKIFEPGILLKLDVQGYEMEALKGATQYLSKISVVQSELSFTELYEGGAQYHEIIDFLKTQGYEIFCILPGFRDEDSGRMLQADAIFTRN